MAWTDDLQQLAYNSPSGVRIVASHENVSKSFDKKTAAFEFPDADGTYVQDLGHTGRRYPLRFFFWGGNYNVESDEFEAALLERGVGKLEHPIYGNVNVVPFGTVTRRDDLKTAANQAVFDVTFWETIGVVYPLAQDAPASVVLTAVSEFSVAMGDEFDAALNTDTASLRAKFENAYISVLEVTSDVLQDIADAQDDVRIQFDAIRDSIEAGIDILVRDPVTLAAQTTQLIQSPARAVVSIRARLNAYANLISIGTTGEGAIAQPGLGPENNNEFRTKDLYLSTYVTGSVVSAVNNQFTLKPEALGAAEEILNQLDAVVNWRDDNFRSLSEIDTGGSYQQLQEAVALCAGFLVEISFTLKQERSIILDRARTIVDLSAELYGEVDAQLDFLISSNNLSGIEILQLPKGRRIVYYV